VTTGTTASLGPPRPDVAEPDVSSRYFEPRVETMPRPGLRALQEERLGEIVEYAYARSALVRDTWQRAGVTPAEVRTLDDFAARAPFLDKDAVRDFRVARRDPFGGLLCIPPGELTLLGATSGTTGNATPLPQQPGGPMVVGLSRDFWEAGGRPGDLVAYIMFTFRAGHAIERFERIPLVPVFINQGTGDIAAFFEASRRFRPTIAYTINNMVINAIAAYVESSGEDPVDAFSSYAGVVFGGEPLPGRTRALLDSWGVRPQEMTTLGDICGAVECRERAGFHAWEDLVLVEHLDLDGSGPAADGERGELVVTALTDRAGPVIRYRSGDIIEFTRKPCACGRTHARFRVLGRRGDEIVVDGRSVLPRDVWPAIEAVPATSAGLFQVIRPGREMRQLRLRVGYPGERPPPGLAGDLADSVEDHVGLRPGIELVPADALLRLGPPHKIPRVSAS
jgi:phenylacetate-CoA ligase